MLIGITKIQGGSFPGSKAELTSYGPASTGLVLPDDFHIKGITAAWIEFGRHERAVESCLLGRDTVQVNFGVWGGNVNFDAGLFFVIAFKSGQKRFAGRLLNRGIKRRSGSRRLR